MQYRVCLFVSFYAIALSCTAHVLSRRCPSNFNPRTPLCSIPPEQRVTAAQTPRRPVAHSPQQAVSSLVHTDAGLAINSGEQRD